MAREQFQTLSEPMYYILLALTKECCGVDIMKEVSVISNNRVKIGQGTLYTLLAKFEINNLIKETNVDGRKKSYIITNSGKRLLKMEYERLKIMSTDGKSIMGDNI